MANTKGCVFVDFETRSKCPIEHGAARYAADPSTDILLVSYAIEDEPTIGFAIQDEPEKLIPLYQYIRNGGILVAHNMLFEAFIIKYVGKQKYGWPSMNYRQFRDTMHLAGRAGLPLSLDGATSALKVTLKDSIGKTLIKTFSIPQKDGSFIEMNDRPKQKLQFIDYCDDDVNGSRDLYKNLPAFIESELEDIAIDFKANLYGVPIDVETSKIVYENVTIEQAGFAERADKLTNGIITKMTQVQRLKKWVVQYVNEDIPNCAAATIIEILEGEYGEVDKVTEQLLLMRQHSGKSSTGKYVRYIHSSIDGRVYGMVLSFGCLAKGTRIWVKTKNGEIETKPIEEVLSSDNVHDGLNWVYHNGVVQTGVKEVVNHEGFNATYDHKVLFDDRMVKLGSVPDYCHLDKNERLYPHAVYRITHDNRKGTYIGVSRTPYSRLHSHIVTAKRENNLPFHEVLLEEEYKGFKIEVVDWYLADEAYRVEYELIKKEKSELWNCKTYNGNTLGLRSQLTNRHINKREKDFIKLRSIWKESGIQELLDQGSKDRKNYYRRLMYLYRDYGYGSDAEFKILLIERDSVKTSGYGMKAVLRNIDQKKDKLNGNKPIIGEAETYDILDAGPLNRYTLENGCIVSNTHTGRVISKLLNLANLPKPSVKYDTMDNLVSDLGSYSILEINDKYGSYLKASATAIRGMITAPEGKMFCIADYGAIEARIVFWLSGCYAGLKKYHDGFDMYVDMATVIFSKAYEDITDDERWVGKNVILGAGFGLGWRGFQNTCRNYGREIPDEMCQTSINGYRESYDEVVDAWNQCDVMAMTACRTGKTTFACNGQLAFKTFKTKSGVMFLLMKLPSGRFMMYPGISIVTTTTPWGARRKAIQYRKVINGKWLFETTYGGKIFQNAVQATARDIMYNGIRNVQNAGYKMLFQVYDEVITEHDEDKIDLDNFCDLLCETPDWAEGLPLIAEGKVLKRYQKI